MTKYIIEGGDIDFYKQLQDESNSEEYEDCCLISNNKLTDRFVTMECGHKFNYIPLYKDLVNHKTKFNNMESTIGALKNDEIRCPYCRKKQNGILPYYEDMGLPKVTGVNYIVEYKKCEYLFPNPLFDPTIDENEITNKKFLGGSCKHEGTKITSIVIDDEKCYCYNHKKYIINKHNYKMKKNEKAKKLEAKLEKKNQEIAKRKEINQTLDKMKHYFNEYELLQHVYIGELEKHKNLVKEEIDTFRIWACSNKKNTIIPINEITTNFEMVILPNLYNQMTGLSSKINQMYKSLVGCDPNENTVVVPNVSINMDNAQNLVTDNHTFDEYNDSWKQFMCTEILKSGKRKGLACLNHKFEDHDVCKKHYLWKTKLAK
jgi:hypothetical protein